jgi:hypothetical protein
MGLIVGRFACSHAPLVDLCLQQATKTHFSTNVELHFFSIINRVSNAINF